MCSLYARVSAFLLLFVASLGATIFSSVTGLIHDPEHRPIQGARVTLSANDSAWAQSTTSDSSGQFRFDTVPVGTYRVKVESPNFVSQDQSVTVTSSSEARLHFPMSIAGAHESVEVRDTAQVADPDSSTSTSVISRRQIAGTPGASDTNSMAMITNYVPGSFVVHDQLHIRGGHQVSWLLDGVPIPNTSIASNVGPQFDPKDIDNIEVQRGGLSSEYGDRTYGVFNVVTRSGFERNREAELVTSFGSFNNTNNQVSIGDHSERFAYYGSLAGYRTDLGLETPATSVINDQAAGLSAFTSLIFNKDAANQFRLVASARGDHYQAPINPTDPLHDVEDERDDFVNFSWLHTLGQGASLTVSPFYHFNRAHYIPNAQDAVLSEYDRGSNFAGGVTSFSVMRGRHNLRTGLQVLAERDDQFYSAVDTQQPGNSFSPARSTPWANNQSFFLDEQFKATSWLTLNAGLRLSHYEGPVSENSADPRIGAAVRIPKLKWALRAFYGRYYQPPPLVTVNNPTFSGTQCQNLANPQCFIALHGERDEQREFGLTIPLAGWAFDVANFRTGARNFFDHDVIGNSNVFFPLTLAHARLRGWEASAASPRLARVVQAHFVYSHAHSEWSGVITGGLIGGDSCDSLCSLDHDQRDTMNSGLDLTLPWRTTSSFDVNYGSGFLDGDGPGHLPAHTSFDLSLAKSFGEKFTVRFTGLNLSNNQYLLDNSNTLGGTHYVNPRTFSGQITYRFRY